MQEPFGGIQLYITNAVCQNRLLACQLAWHISSRDSY